MKPLRPKEIILKFSAEEDINPDDMQDIIDFYYKGIQRELSRGNHHNIAVVGLGVFYLLTKRAEKKIEHLNNLVNSLKLNSLRSYEVRQEKLNEVERLKRLISLVNDDKVKKQNIRNLQNNLRNEEFNKNMEE